MASSGVTNSLISLGSRGGQTKENDYNYLGYLPQCRLVLLVGLFFCSLLCKYSLYQGYPYFTEVFSAFSVCFSALIFFMELNMKDNKYLSLSTFIILLSDAKENSNST